ncbi:MAG: NADH-quinone oxidoreductase subunit L, partial [Synechococcaceae cyanobacterium]
MVAATPHPSPAPSANAAPRRLRCCDASGCRHAGGPALRQALEAALADHRRDGDSAALEIRRVGCLRLCGRGPLVAEDGPLGPRLYGALPADQAATLVKRPDARSLEPWRLSLRQPFFALQRPVVLETCGLVDPESIEDALALGTYATLRRCLEQLTPEQVREQVRRSGLRGRGGAGYPTGLKWDTVALQPPGPRWVVCNADEGDPGAFMDRSVLEGDPHRLIEGLAIAAYAVGANQGFVYLRAEYPLAVERLRRALDQARARGWLGPTIGGSRFG